MGKRALITGITGQDGSYLAELLLEKGYQVYGMRRRTSTPNLVNLEGILERITLAYGDMTDWGSLKKVVREVKPDEVYNLAAQSFVAVSFDQRELTFNVNWFGVERLLWALVQDARDARFYQASSSEMFGGVKTVPQNEETPFVAVSPYGESKLEAHRFVARVRKAEGLFACSGILFNHESPRRGEEFVTRKIARAAVRIAAGQERELRLGNLDAEKDWGYAGDYVKAMWLMLQQDKPDDYVIASGEKHTVREFAERAFSHAGKSIQWRGKGADEKGFVDGHSMLHVDPRFFRPTDTQPFLGDTSKARRILGWQPSVSFDELVRVMVRAEQERPGNAR